MIRRPIRNSSPTRVDAKRSNHHNYRLGQVRLNLHVGRMSLKCQLSVSGAATQFLPPSGRRAGAKTSPSPLHHFLVWRRRPGIGPWRSAGLIYRDDRPRFRSFKLGQGGRPISVKLNFEHLLTLLCRPRKSLNEGRKIFCGPLLEFFWWYVLVSFIFFFRVLIYIF